jgi:light-regulated signal transduction histidine kinase (bacteriophytochrome)
VSAARPPEGAQHRSAQHEGTPVTSAARPPEGAQHRSAQHEGTPVTSVARPPEGAPVAIDVPRPGDAGELAALRARLAACEAELAQARQGAEDFLRMVSHDLRAPLRHVLAYSGLVREMLAEREDPTAALGTLDASARQLGQMFDAVVEQARLAVAPLVVTTVPTGLVVQEVRQALAPETAGRDIDWAIAGDLPDVPGDVAQQRLVWRHLLANAIKFTRPRAPARIEIGWEPTPGGPCFTVRDNGVGFVSARAGNLFQLFQRLHPASQFEGLGTGLAVVQQVVHRHGGTVGIDGGPDTGCRVRFTLA